MRNIFFVRKIAPLFDWTAEEQSISKGSWYLKNPGGLPRGGFIPSTRHYLYGYMYSYTWGSIEEKECEGGWAGSGSFGGFQAFIMPTVAPSKEPWQDRSTLVEGVWKRKMRLARIKNLAGIVELWAWNPLVSGDWSDKSLAQNGRKVDKRWTNGVAIF